jgi:hypothetical protein
MTVAQQAVEQGSGGRTATLAAFRQALAVSRRTPVVCALRRKGQPSFPSAMTCCFFSALKTLLMPTGRMSAPLESMSRALSLAGFQVTLIGRFWVTPETKS